MYISKREEKRRLHKLQHMSKEELLQLYYMQQERNAYTCNMTYERHIFDMCKGSRTQKRVRNTFSREEMGTCPQVLRAVRTGEHSVCVCKGWANKY